MLQVHSYVLKLKGVTMSSSLNIPVMSLFAMEKEFSILIDFFRKLSMSKDAGYAGDHSGYGFFDLNESQEGFSSDICLYCEEYTFRIQHNGDTSNQYNIYIDKESQKSEVLGKTSTEVVGIISEILGSLDVDNLIYSENQLIQNLEKNLVPLLKEGWEVINHQNRNVFCSIHLNELDLIRIRFSSTGYVVDLITDYYIKTIGVGRHEAETGIVKACKKMLEKYAKALE